MVTKIKVDQEVHRLTPPRLTLNWTIPKKKEMQCSIRSRGKYVKEKRLKFPAITQHFGIFGITKKIRLYLSMNN